ncbi:MAG TPA: chemotaxis-specific protein-glutamate methyltransferase CheB [Thermoanaerobaculia bacterium]|nr:chemotaxis-specific protein-glutamate methyltransferase CheB [Thermoanaerobaculia bacterium]
MIRVLVVDDSAFSRVTISRMIQRDPELKVVATATRGEEAIRLALAHRPDVVTLDLEMPGLDGFAVLRWLAANLPVPAIVVSSRQGRDDVFRALDLGAVDFVLKPQAHASLEYERLESVLIAKIRAIAEARPPRAAAPRRPVPPAAPIASGASALLVIGASTGGPAALTALFAALPPLACPVVVAQHMPAGFTGLFAERLTRVARFPVVEAHAGQALHPGRAYVAPGGAHLEIARDDGSWRARVEERAPRDLFSPSVDRLFRSAAAAAGAGALGVILTGMGSDGREGVVAIRASGGRTIAESEESAVVFGMPREAALSGAIDEVRPLGEIPAAILRLLRADPK